MINPVRLEIVQDDHVTAPRLSRVRPALLYDIVAETSYIDFCTTIDALLSRMAVDYRCHAKRLLWWNLGMAFWIVVLCGFYFAALLQLKSVLFYYSAYTCFILSIMYMVTVRIWMNCPTGTIPATETMKEIRAECEVMTNRTPHASFHVVLTPFATTLRGHHHLYANPIGFIEVSVSVVGFELAKAKAGLTPSAAPNTNENNKGNVSLPALHTTSTVTSDYHLYGSV